MTDFGNLLGTLLSSLAHARRIADEETAAIAEYYKDNPLLEGMSAPRIRVPELRLELPMLIETFEQGITPMLEDDSIIIKKVIKELQAVFKEQDLSINLKLQERVQKGIQNDLTKLRKFSTSNNIVQREQIARIVDIAFLNSIQALESIDRIPQSKVNQIAKHLRMTARAVAFKEDPRPSKIKASIITEEVKERASAGNVVRLQIIMKEEGLEWDIIQHSDGTTTSRLSLE